MAVIKTKGAFEFFYPTTETYKKIWCVLKSGETVQADFDDLQITYKGTVLVAITYKNQPDKKDYVSLKKIIYQKEADIEYLNFISKEINLIEQKRKNELKLQQKERKNHQKMTA